MKKSIVKAIEAHFEIPENIAKLARLASWDLYSGPLTFCEECGVDHLDDCECDIKYPGFQKACEIVGEWASDNLRTIYVCDDSACVMTREPEGVYAKVNEDGDYEECDENDEGAFYDEPMPYYEFDYSELVGILFDSELKSYL